MPRDASELARRLARDAEAVCRHYLSNGRRQGRYWTVGDVRNTPGRSMFVRLSGPESGPGAAGHWTDAASAEHGDLLDVIRESCGFIDFRDVADEARRFLSLPRAEPRRSPRPVRTPVPAGSPEAAQRLFAMSQPIRGTLVEEKMIDPEDVIAAWPDLGCSPAELAGPAPNGVRACESWVLSQCSPMSRRRPVRSTSGSTRWAVLASPAGQHRPGGRVPQAD